MRRILGWVVLLALGTASSAAGQRPSTLIYGQDAGTQRAVAVNATGQLSITCANCSGSGASFVDDAAFTAASSSGAPIMGFVTSDSVESGDVGVVGMLANRQLKMTLYNSSGAEVTSFGGGTEYAEDAVHASGNSGGLSLVVRNDAGTALAADGDYIPLTVNSAGALYVAGSVTANAGTNLNTSALALEAGNIATVAGDTTDIEAAIEQLDHAEDAAHSTGQFGVMALAVRQDTQVDFGADGDYAPLSIDADGALRVTGGGGGTQYAEDAVHASGNLGTMALAVRQDTQADFAADGDYVPLSIDADGALRVTGGGGGTQDAEDAVHASGDTGTLGLAIRQDSHVDLAADGDYIPMTVDAAGGLRVSIVAGAGSGGTALADDADFTAGTTSFTPMGGFYQSTVTACTDGDTCAAGITAGRAVKVTLSNADGTLATYATDATIGTAIGTAGPLSLRVYSDFDGSALPTITNVDTEGEAVPPAASIKGVQYVMVVSEDGALERGTATTPLIVGDGTGALNTIVDSGTLTAVTTITNAVTVTDGAGSLNVICDSGCSGGTQYAEDAVHASGNTGTMALAVRQDTQVDFAADGDYVPLSIDADGALRVTGGGGGTQYAEDAVHASGNTGTLGLVVRQDSHTDLAADGDYIPMTVDADGGLRVSIVAGAGSGGTAVADDADFTAGTTSFTPVGGFYQSGTPTACTDGDACTASITVGRVLKVAYANADGTLVTPSVDYTEDTSGSAGGQFGPMVMGILRAEGSSLGTAGADGDYANLTMSAAGELYTNGRSNSNHYRTSNATGTDEFEVKATPGWMTGGLITNTAATVAYLRCVNDQAADTTPGSGTIVFSAAIPGATTGAGFALPVPQGGFYFSSGLTCWLSTGEADSNTTAVGADDIKVNIFYR